MQNYYFSVLLSGSTGGVGVDLILRNCYYVYHKYFSRNCIGASDLIIKLLLRDSDFNPFQGDNLKREKALELSARIEASNIFFCQLRIRCTYKCFC